MAIRDVVLRGFGNGAFSGTIAKVVTRGYSIGVPAVVIDGPFRAMATQVYVPGADASQILVPGADASEVVA